MPPKKSANPPPQSDESASDFDEEETVRKQQKKTKKVAPPKKRAVPRESTQDDPEQELLKAADEMFENKEQDDESVDLFALKIPPRPNFLGKSPKNDRLMIMNVEVENFKSYFGKASIGPFHKSFTSIIGPNGSGKSNLIDSLLFVFGFRAAKIRSNKVANLIHKSAGREPDSCTVTIHFQRIIDVPGHYEIVKDSAFEISRTAFKNSSSSYAIDGRTASKVEVEARLRQVDIDIEHNRFLILQGEVEQIAMMKPVKQNKADTGMVEYLEDIVGSNRLEPFVKLFDARVKRLYCVQTQQRISRDHAKKSKEAMEPQVKAAVEYLVKENEKTTIKMKLDQRMRYRLLEQVAPIQAKVEEKKDGLKSITEKMNAIKTENSNLEVEENRLSSEKTKIDSEIDRTTNEINDFETEEKNRQETIKRHQTDISKTESEMEKEERKKKNFIDLPEKAEKKIQKLKEEREKLLEAEKTAIEKADENGKVFDEEKEKFDKDLKETQETCSKYSKEFDTANAAATMAKEDLAEIKEKATSGKKKLDDLNEQLESLDAEYSRDKASLESLKSNYEEMTKQNNEIEAMLPDVRDKYAQVNRNINGAHEQLESIRQRNAMCNQGETKLHRRLREEKEAGRIPSYIGRLGDLGVIDKKYEVALCTNFANILNYVVLGCADDAAKAIDLSCKELLGRFSSVSLDTVKRHPESDLKNIPGRFPGPRLVDLIECEPEYRGLMYDRLRNTLVADSTSQAIRWSKSHPSVGNIVTLQGHLIQSNGNVTGGGAVGRGLMITDKNKKPKKVTPEDIAAQKKLEGEVEQLRQESNRLKQQKNDAEQVLMRNKHALAALKGNMANLESSVNLKGPQIESLKKLVEVQEEEAKNVTVDEKDIEEKEKIVQDLEKKLNDVSAKTKESKKRQGEIQAKVDEIYKELVGRYKDEAKNAVTNRQKVDKDIAKEQANVASSSRNVARCEENIARFMKDIEKKRRLCEELQEKAVDEEMLDAKKTHLEELSKKRTEIEAQQGEVTTKQAELVESEGEWKKKKKETDEEITALMSQMAGHKENVKKLDKELDGLKINRIPRFKFLAASSNPEDLAMSLDDIQSDENESPEEAEKNKKQMASSIGDQAYAQEYHLRRERMDNAEAYEYDRDDKMVPLELLKPEQIAEISERDVAQLNFDLKNCQSQLDTSKPKVDISIIDAYVIKVNHYNDQVRILAEVTANHDRHNDRLQQLKRDRLDEFHSAFEFIGKHLVAVYKMLTDGGDAKLEYIDKDDPFKEGISFMVRPAKKAWKQIQYLSGGEKTLSSLALIFALHMFRPTPFYVMDEIDAALDYRNVSIIAQYVRQKTENAQFIIISLRNNMFELANRLVGIYKVEGCTKNVAIDPEKVCEMAKSISDSLGQVTCTLPGEVTNRFNETMSRNRQKITANEKQYPNFPSTNDISKAEKIVSVEGRVRKEMNQTDAGLPGPSRSQSKATNHTDRAASTRPESRVNQIRVPNTRLVERASTVTSQTPRKERNTEPDETTPPVKRSTSAAPRSPEPTGTSPRRKKQDDEEEGEGDSD